MAWTVLVLALLPGLVDAPETSGVLDDGVQVRVAGAEVDATDGRISVPGVVEVDLDAGHLALPVATDKSTQAKRSTSEPSANGLTPDQAATGSAAAFGGAGIAFVLWRAARSIVAHGATGRLLALLPFSTPFLLFSRIHDDEVLDHPTRRAALAFVQAHPGATLRQVQDHLEVAWGTTIHHVTRLRRAGLLCSRRQGGQRILWSANVGRPQGPDDALAHAVQSEPGTTPSDLATRFGWSRPTVAKRLRRLLEQGIVRVEQEGRRRAYYPA